MVIDNNFAEQVIERSSQNIKVCYQCLKCFAGCPVSKYMDYKPNSVIRLIQYGMKEKVLKSHAVWLCVSCMTCGVRCPNEIDMSSVFDALREMSREEDYAYESEKKVVLLHEEFLRSVRMWGRLSELTFYMGYMLRSLDIVGNIPSAVTLVSKGKIPFIPKQIEGIEELWELYEKAYKTKGQLKGKE